MSEETQEVRPEVERYVFGCCSWEDVWLPKYRGDPHPDVRGWGNESYTHSYVASSDYDALVDEALLLKKRIASLEAERDAALQEISKMARQLHPEDRRLF